MEQIKKTVLIIEDEEAMLRILRDEIEYAGYNTISVTDGLIGLLKAIESQPDLILLDILLPDTNGLEVLEKIRINDGEYGKNVPIIILTNLSPNTEAINKIIIEASPTYYLVKANFTTSQVIEKIKELLLVVN